MELKRVYDPADKADWMQRREAHVEARRAAVVQSLGIEPAEAETLLRQRFVDLNGVPKVIAVEPVRLQRRQIISRRLVEQAAAEGWGSMADGRITLKTPPGTPDVVYRIERGPGRYCCHCGVKVEAGKERPAHMSEHEGEASPDPNNPAGWRTLNGYECVLEPSKESDNG